MADEVTKKDLQSLQGFVNKQIGEIEKRLKVEQSNRGDFARVHVCPASSADIADDDLSARLVILKPQYTHALHDVQSKARQAATDILNRRGNAPRSL